jgi:hypothetical protein
MSHLTPLDSTFPVPLDGGIPEFWGLARELRERNWAVWDRETKRAARWANGPLPIGYEHQWTAFVQPAPRSWPPELRAPANRPAVTYAAAPLPQLPPGMSDRPPEIAHDHSGWQEATPEEAAELDRIWDEPPGRPFLGRWLNRGTHQ